MNKSLQDKYYFDENFKIPLTVETAQQYFMQSIFYDQHEAQQQQITLDIKQETDFFIIQKRMRYRNQSSTIGVFYIIQNVIFPSSQISHIIDSKINNVSQIYLTMKDITQKYNFSIKQNQWKFQEYDGQIQNETVTLKTNFY